MMPLDGEAAMDDAQPGTTFTLDCGGTDRAALAGSLHFDHPLGEYNSWHVGGRSDCFYAPSDVEDLAFFLNRCSGDHPVTCVGLGSNLLVRDGGVRGIVISLRRGFGEIGHSGAAVYAQAGVTCAQLAHYCADHGLAGLEFIVGVPGTVGGALAMNAGAFGGEIWEPVVAVDVVGRDGTVRRRGADEFEVGYREVGSPVREEWFVAGHFELSPGADSRELKERIKEFLKRRRETQPLGRPNCGSVFRNPESLHAARLIEECGLKGCAIGAAQVSGKHANFIVNNGGASASDIEALIRHVQSIVARKTGVELRTEVKIIGEVL